MLTNAEEYLRCFHLQPMILEVGFADGKDVDASAKVQGVTDHAICVITNIIDCTNIPQVLIRQLRLSYIYIYKYSVLATILYEIISPRMFLFQLKRSFT